MNTIKDYLDWRGDLSFAVSPLNEVDNYILAKIGSADYTGIAGFEEPVDLNTAIEVLKAEPRRTVLGTLSSKAIIPCIMRLPETVRFSGLKIWGFESKFSAEETEQFSALTVLLPDGSSYVSFRGTDDTIVAWKEDFLLGVQDSVNAQKDAAEYLKLAAEKIPGPLIIGGHSKGGNLSVYAAATADPSVQDRIIAVYSNDGPGFSEEFLSSEGYLRIRDRVTTLISQHSIVGTMLTQDRVTVVRSGSFGIPAHDAFNWEVLGTRFVRCASLSKPSLVIDETMETVLKEMTEKQKRQFVDEFFEVLESTGAVTVSDFSEKRIRKALELARSLKREPGVHKFVLQVLEQMVKEIHNAVKNGEQDKA